MGSYLLLQKEQGMMLYKCCAIFGLDFFSSDNRGYLDQLMTNLMGP